MEEVQVAVAIGAVVEHTDLVVDAFQRPRRDGTEIESQDAIDGRLQRPA